MIGWIRELLGAEADSLLKYECKGIPRQSLQLPGPDYLDRVFLPSDRTFRHNAECRPMPTRLAW